MIEQPPQAYLLWNVEPSTTQPTRWRRQRHSAAAETVIAFSAYRNGALEYADVILPITPFTETAVRSSAPRGACRGFQRHRAAARRSAPGLEGPARAGQPPGADGIRAGHP